MKYETYVSFNLNVLVCLLSVSGGLSNCHSFPMVFSHRNSSLFKLGAITQIRLTYIPDDIVVQPIRLFGWETSSHIYYTALLPKLCQI